MILHHRTILYVQDIYTIARLVSVCRVPPKELSTDDVLASSDTLELLQQHIIGPSIDDLLPLPSLEEEAHSASIPVNQLAASI